MSPRASEMLVRAGVGGALIVLAAGALWMGGFGFWLVVVIAALLMVREWAALSEAREAQMRLAQYALSVPLAILCPLAAGPGFLALGMVLGAGLFIWLATRNVKLAGGMLYIGLPVLALVFLRAQVAGALVPDGFLLTLWAMALVWMTDIGAYFVGRSVGGPLLAPVISPAKTWSGFWGGVAAAALFGVVMTHFGLPWWMAAATPFLAMLAHMGDLFESFLKRKAGVKDSGHLLPGHGGIMDRLDGLVPVALAVALLVLIARTIA